MPDYENPSAGSVPPLTAHQIVALYEELRGHYAERNARYARSRELYRGEHWGGSDLPMPSGAGRATLTVNYIKPTVNKTVEDLFGILPGIQILPRDVDEESARQAEGEEGVLYQTWHVNNAEVTFRRLAFNAALLDQGVLYYWWDKSSKRVRFRSIPPDNFYPLYDGDELVECIIMSRRLTRLLQKTYPDLADKIFSDGGENQSGRGDEESANTAGLFEADRFDGDNVLIPQASQTQAAGYTTVMDWFDHDGNWTRIMGDAVHHQKLPYGTGRVPVFVFPITIAGDDAIGPSVIQDIIDLNIYADKLLSQSADIIKRYSNPTLLDKQSGQSAERIRDTVQADGGVIPVKRDGDIVYLNWQGTPPDIQAQWERVMTAIYDLSGKPAATAFGQILSNQSGTASNMASSPMANQTQTHRGVFGHVLSQLNGDILKLYEKYVAGKVIDVKVSANVRPGTSAFKAYDSTQRGITGAQIAGWYENRIKWPALLRTDDPLYVQTELTKMKADGNNPPAQSQYTTMENLGIEDVERERDRIQAELEDPRMHPERLTAAMDAAQIMSGGMAATDPMAQGLDGSAPVMDPDLDAALNATGNPNGSKSTKASTKEY